MHDNSGSCSAADEAFHCSRRAFRSFAADFLARPSCWVAAALTISIAPKEREAPLGDTARIPSNMSTNPCAQASMPMPACAYPLGASRG